MALNDRVTQGSPSGRTDEAQGGQQAILRSVQHPWLGGVPLELAGFTPVCGHLLGRVTQAGRRAGRAVVLRHDGLCQERHRATSSATQPSPSEIFQSEVELCAPGVNKTRQGLRAAGLGAWGDALWIGLRFLCTDRR